MAKICFDHNNLALAIWTANAVPADSPAGTMTVIEFDAETNLALVTALERATGRVALAGSAVIVDGASYAVAAAGQRFADWLSAEAFLPTIESEIAALEQGLASYAGMTNAQKQAFVVSNFDRIMKENQALLRAIRWMIQASP